jgi:hypothetical protein
MQKFQQSYSANTQQKTTQTQTPVGATGQAKTKKPAKTKKEK